MVRGSLLHLKKIDESSKFQDLRYMVSAYEYIGNQDLIRFFS